jgi:transposase
MAKKETCVGIDVSKATLDVSVLPTAESWQSMNDEGGIRELVRRVKKLSPTLVILEATGGLERAVTAALMAENLPAVVVNPRQVREFARSTGQLAKTDRIDAEMLALFGERVRPEPRLLPNEMLRGLEAMATRRRQLTHMLTAEKNRLGSAAPAIRDGIRKHIDWLQTQLKDVDRDIGQLIKESPVWRAKDKLLQSAKGVGPRLSHMLIAKLPELGTLGGKQISALVGVAPLACDSGKHKGKRAVWGGRASVREVLYMGTLVATRHNPVIRDFYQRLIASGKAKKVALTACMRKLLTILNAMMRTQTPWNPEKFHPSLDI